MEEKFFYKSGNYKLCGVINKLNNIDTIAVICHPRTSSKDSRAVTKIANELSKNNINNFRFDFVSSGESSGTYKDYLITNMVNNLEDTLNMLIKKYKYKYFILIGCSLGSRIIVLINHNNYNISKLIFWYGAFDYGRILCIPNKCEKFAKKNGFYIGERNWKYCYEYFVDERKYRAYKRLYKLNIPKLFIHGTKDPFVNYKSSIKISKKCINSELSLIKDGDHGFHNEKHILIALNRTLEFIGENNENN